MVDGAVLVVLVQRIQCVVDFGEQRCVGEGILAGKSESVVTTVIVDQGRVHLSQVCTNTIPLVSNSFDRHISNCCRNRGAKFITNAFL